MGAAWGETEDHLEGGEQVMANLNGHLMTNNAELKNYNDLTKTFTLNTMYNTRVQPNSP